MADYDSILAQAALVQDYRFGNQRSDATVKNKSDIDLVAACRYIYCGYSVPPRYPYSPVGNGCDGLYGNYSGRHADTPEGDPGSLHVFTPNSLKLKGYNIPAAGIPGSVLKNTSNPPGAFGTGSLGGLMRFYAPLNPDNFLVRTRAKAPPAAWGWMALWANNGTECYGQGPGRGQIGPSGINYENEWDNQDGFGYASVTPGTLVRPGIPTGGNTILWQLPSFEENPNWDYEPPGMQPGWESKDFHEYAMSRQNQIITFYLDGVAYRQDHAPWRPNGGQAMHWIIGCQIAAYFNGPPNPLPDPGPDGWTVEVSDCQVYQFKAGVMPPNPGGLNPPPGTGLSADSGTAQWPQPSCPWSPPAVLSSLLAPPANASYGAVNPSTYASPSPPVTPPQPHSSHAASPVGATVTTAKGGPLYDKQGNSQTLNAVPGQILLNGEIVPSSDDVMVLVWDGSETAQQNGKGAWWTSPNDGTPGTQLAGPPTCYVPPKVVSVLLAEDAWQGDAQCTIAVDGKVVGGVTTVTALHNKGATQVVSLGTLAPGKHSIVVTFINDAYGGTPETDRNLYIVGYEVGAAVTKLNFKQYSSGSYSFTVTV